MKSLRQRRRPIANAEVAERRGGWCTEPEEARAAGRLDLGVAAQIAAYADLGAV
jgi:hypothetical protein